MNASTQRRSRAAVDRRVLNASALRLAEGGDEPLWRSEAPGFDEEFSQLDRIYPIERDADPPETAHVGGDRERCRIEVDELGLGRRGRLDREGVAVVTADGEDL